MRTSVILRAVEAARPRVPLIKFRGSQQSVEHLQPFKPVQSGTPMPKLGQSKEQIVIQDYQLPLRFRRLALDQREIDAINTGGAI